MCRIGWFDTLYPPQISIKKELIAEEEGGIKNVGRIINRKLNTNDDWKMFEETFNKADKGFIHKLKSAHP